jgi:UDP-galactopyranose mutase
MKNKVFVIGAGFYGATVAERLSRDSDVVVLEARNVIGGNAATEWDPMSGVQVSLYGAHIFHTNSKQVWNYITQFSTFNSYRHYVKGLLPSGKFVDLPFNLSLFNAIVGVKTPKELVSYLTHLPQVSGDNLEAHCISTVGREVFEAVVKNYTEKQWGKPCSELPASIIARLPVRPTHDTTYFNSALFQGMPTAGYSELINRMLGGIEVEVNTQVDRKRLEGLHAQGDRIFFSGQLDALFDYDLGVLPYRGLRFDHRREGVAYAQGAPVINDLTTSSKTRTIEHKMFYPEVEHTTTTWVTDEYPTEWKKGDIPYYPIPSEEASSLHNKYLDLAKKYFHKMIVGGRLGSFKYYDMDQVIAMAMKDSK